MVKVLHYDYDEDYLFEFGPNFVSRFDGKIPGIDYKRHENKFGIFEFDEKGLAQQIASENPDVLLIHPGLRGLDTIIREYPKKFPNLRIGLISYLKDNYDVERTREKLGRSIAEYSRPENMAVLSYLNVDGVINFILSNP